MELMRQNFVNLCDQYGHFGNELNKSLWNEHNSVIFAKGRTLANYVRNISGNLGKRLVFRLHFLTDEDAVGPGSECTLESNV